MATAKQTEQSEAIERLREWIKPGDTVYTILRHVSSSGMSRVIQLVSFEVRDGKPSPLFIGYNVAKALDYRWDNHKEGIKIGGTGMDMGFALVYELSRALFDDGYAINHRWL